jgi:hypothetical protein
MTAREIAKKLMDDLDNRAGFDLGNIDKGTLKEWEDLWTEIIFTATVKNQERHENEQ